MDGRKEVKYLSLPEFGPPSMADPEVCLQWGYLWIFRAGSLWRRTMRLGIAHSPQPGYHGWVCSQTCQECWSRIGRGQSPPQLQSGWWRCLLFCTFVFEVFQEPWQILQFLTSWKLQRNVFVCLWFSHCSCSYKMFKAVQNISSQDWNFSQLGTAFVASTITTLNCITVWLVAARLLCCISSP